MVTTESLHVDEKMGRWEEGWDDPSFVSKNETELRKSINMRAALNPIKTLP